MKNEEQWIQTFTGKKFYPFNPKAKDVCIEDIAHSLSLICRFNGHCREFYSVAQHSVNVSYIIEANKGFVNYLHDPAQFGLLHDAAEAYLGDVVAPIKSKNDVDNEDLVRRVIWTKFGLVGGFVDIDEMVKDADKMALAMEKVVLMKYYLKWPGVCDIDPTTVDITPQSPKEAEESFLKRFDELFEKQLYKRGKYNE